MRAIVVSSSLDKSSRSERLAEMYMNALASMSCEAELVSLKKYVLPRFDNGDGIAFDPVYQTLHGLVSTADGLVLASPVYNWGCCAELKRFIEVIGATPPDSSLRGAFFDKVVTFVNAAGLPHSYTAFSSIAMSMMVDFKCIINPYNVYVHDRDWFNIQLCDHAANRLNKSANVMTELMRCLATRSYRSQWKI